MLTKNQIIEQLFTGKNFNDCIRKMEPEHLQEDLKQEVMLILCEQPEERILGLYERKELEFFTARIILNQVKSNSSAFTKTYRWATNELNGTEIAHHVSDLEERKMREDLRRFATEEIDRLYWYNAELVRMYIRLGSYRAIEERTYIPFESCYKTIKESFRILNDRAIKKQKEQEEEERVKKYESIIKKYCHTCKSKKLLKNFRRFKIKTVSKIRVFKVKRVEKKLWYWRSECKVCEAKKNKKEISTDKNRLYVQRYRAKNKDKLNAKRREKRAELNKNKPLFTKEETQFIKK